MKLDIATLVRASIETVRAPRSAARRVMAVEMDRNDRWMVLLLVSVVSAGLAYLSLMVSAFVSGVDVAEISKATPFLLATSQTAVLFISAFAIDIVGRRAGGTGELNDAILLVAWIQVVLAVLQIAQIALLFVAPSLALVLGFAGMVLLFVLLTVFVSELHGFQSIGGIFMSVLLVMLVLATLLRFVFRLFGYDMLGIV